MEEGRESDLLGICFKSLSILNKTKNTLSSLKVSKTQMVLLNQRVKSIRDRMVIVTEQKTHPLITSLLMSTVEMVTYSFICDILIFVKNTKSSSSYHQISNHFCFQCDSRISFHHFGFVTNLNQSKTLIETGQVMSTI